MRAKKIALPGLFIALASGPLISQEALLSTAENYYEFLALDGSLERPYLNYRTLSDSVWDTSGLTNDIWSGNDLGGIRYVGDNFAYRVYGPELFTSYNSAAPYGQNDGALWQGKGFNSSLTGGARGEASFGDTKVELTLKPTVYGSQNLPFTYAAPAYSSTVANGIYAGKAAEYGYFGVRYIDAPQRFGDDPVYGFSWGDSEVRLSWKTLTIGFGTQSVWLGPARINPILMSNNATPFPKLDVGLRKTELIVPYFGWNLGSLETRLVAGYLSESDWFDNDSGNDHHLLSLLTIGYSPSILPGLTLFANRVYLSKFDETGFFALGHLFFINLEGGGNQDVWDQRASIGFDWLIPIGGIEIYGEAGINDYAPSSLGYIRYPFHTMVYSAGLQKSFLLPFDIKADLLIEWSNLEISQDLQFQWPCTFYAHHIITTGYTNDGQWLGAGYGTGGNSQYFGIRSWLGSGAITVYLARNGIDNDYIYAKAIGTVNPANDLETAILDFRATITPGITGTWFITPQVSLFSELALVFEHNPTYEGVSWRKTDIRSNPRFVCSLQWTP